MSGADDSWAVGLATYRRPDGLARVIDHIGRAAARLGRVPALIVVDNDGQDPAIAALAAERAAAAGLVLHFIVEPTPGISAARNAVFAKADAIGARFMAMIDDDEWPADDWLTALDARRRETGAHIVGGPVTPVFPDNAKALERIARWWSVQPQLLEGKPFVFCTCNFLIDLAAVADMPRPLFDPRFGLSGGGDTVFFRSLFYAGHPMAWADAALVYEEVPPSRASLGWMRQRRYRVGNHAVNWEVRDQGRAKALAKTMGLTARLAFYPLLGREPEARMTGWLLEAEKVRGRWNAHRGALYMEYARADAPANEKACR
ncbi:glycosyltransferase family A protein [Sphingomonas sp. 1P06PA]|uniref:glycosyltransferase family 2 protein n=1 Tax=Sphingomonas sp. 1P06PA TaxID=554121 RepID=UPI0039A4730C